MSVIVNTNVQSLIAQRNLTASTNALSNATLQLSTGLKINHAADDAAGLFIAKGLEAQLSGSQQCQTNIALGINVLQIAEGDLITIQDNVLRIKDLATQAASGVYSTTARGAMQAEIESRLEEIDRLAAASTFNGFNLLDGNAILEDGLRLQVGAGSNSDINSINVKGVFGSSMTWDFFLSNKKAENGNYLDGNGNIVYQKDGDNYKDKNGNVVFEKSGNNYIDKRTGETISGSNIEAKLRMVLSTSTAAVAANAIQNCEEALTMLTTRRSNLGVAQARLEMASEGLATTIENISQAKSTIMDTDVAKTTSEYTKAQILQQISSSVLTQANQAPQIALSLMGS